ncbi:MAG: hypothetical protein [Cressdnaviricota sp.]|nr:MAG: hypothetical protein [Cressdnaviricota sp.]
MELISSSVKLFNVKHQRFAGEICFLRGGLVLPPSLELLELLELMELIIIYTNIKKKYKITQKFSIFVKKRQICQKTPNSLKKRQIQQNKFSISAKFIFSR